MQVQYAARRHSPLEEMYRGNIAVFIAPSWAERLLKLFLIAIVMRVINNLQIFSRVFVIMLKIETFICV